MALAARPLAPVAGANGTITAGAADGLAPAAWDALVSPGQGPLRHGFVGAWRQVELRSLRSEPLVARSGGSVVGAAHAYVYDLDMAGGADSRLTRQLELVRRLLPRALVARVLELGSPTPLVNPFLSDGAPAEGVVEAIVETAIRSAREQGADMMIVQNFETGACRGGTSRALRTHGFSAIPIAPTVVVPLPFATFDAYVDAMRAQYRRRLRQVFERSAHLRVEYVPEFGGAADELARLWRLVWDRARELKREVLSPGFFRAASELDYVTVLALRRPDGSLACYALLLEDAPWLHFLYTGFEREAGEREGAYFRLIYEIVRYAIDGGFPVVNLGMTTLEPKLDAGGMVVPLTAWIRHRRAAVHALEVGLARGPFAPKAVPPRRVFKFGAPRAV